MVPPPISTRLPPQRAITTTSVRALDRDRRRRRLVTHNTTRNRLVVSRAPIVTTVALVAALAIGRRDFPMRRDPSSAAVVAIGRDRTAAIVRIIIGAPTMRDVGKGATVRRDMSGTIPTRDQGRDHRDRVRNEVVAALRIVVDTVAVVVVVATVVATARNRHESWSTIRASRRYAASKKKIIILQSILAQVMDI